MSEFLQACQEAARAGGAVLMQWRGKFKAREKGPSDLVTEADSASQERIRELLLSRFPDHGFLGEEDGTDIAPRDGRHRWIVDPLDGTVNYVHGVPNFAVSVALECDGQIIAGAVYDPSLDECFTAEAGGGAYLNGEPIRTSGATQLTEALVVASFPAGIRSGHPEIERFIRALVATQSLRRTGSAALNLSYLAAGRFDGYWATTTKIWDIAAGVLIVTEAGGALTSPEGGEVDLAKPRFVAAATPQLQQALRACLDGAQGL
jgi:myo-inositol-1(or 4)-monophosphatase